MDRWKAPTLVLGIWAGTAIIAGVRTHARGGVFGEAIGPGQSIAAQALLAVPWLLAVGVAWWAAGRWPVRRHDVLRPITVHGWIGLAVVTAQQLLSTALSTLLPIGLRPLDPWSRVPEYLTHRGPVAFAVYLVLVAGCVAIRDERDRPQEAPVAGSDESL